MSNNLTVHCLCVNRHHLCVHASISGSGHVYDTVCKRQLTSGMCCRVFRRDAVAGVQSDE